MPNVNPMSQSPPGAFLPWFPFIIPPGTDVSEGESYPPTFGFLGPAPAWADPALTWPADIPPAPTVASPYLLLGPGQTPGFGPSRYAPGLFPAWAVESPEEGEYIPPSGPSAYVLLGPGMTPGLTPSPRYPNTPYAASNFSYAPYVIAGLKMHARFSTRQPSMTWTVE
jgi:hypothetical protein